MRAYRILDWERQPRWSRSPTRSPPPGRSWSAWPATGCRHSDAMMSLMPREIGELMDWRVPFTLGHETAGHVVEVGAGVTAVEPGDAVALVSAYSCGTCSFCLSGHDNACPENRAGRGYGRDGGLAELVVVDSERAIIPLRTLDPVSAGPLTDAGATAYHGVKRVLPKLIPGSTAVVIGAGGLGAFAVQLLRALSPATIVAVDASTTRLDYARELGAHVALKGVDDSTTELVRELTNGDGAHAVLDFVGIDATIDAGLASLRRVGSFALVGAGGGSLRRPWFGFVPQDAEMFTFQGASIADAREVIALAEAGLITSDIDVFPLDRVADAYAALEAGSLRGRDGRRSVVARNHGRVCEDADVALQSFSHVGVCVSDLDLSTRFYTEVLGFVELFSMEMGPGLEATMEVEAPRFESRMLARHDVRIELLRWHEPTADGPRTRRPMTQFGLTHLCFRVENVDDLADAAEAAGGHVHRDTLSVLADAGGPGIPVKVMYLTDPDGTRVECMEGSPDLAAFGPQP